MPILTEKLPHQPWRARYARTISLWIWLSRKRSFPELPSACPAAPEPAGRSRSACRRFV